MTNKNTNREQWGSKIGFILAAAGSAIGLGNIWRFPYVAGENGGAAFIIIFLLCIAVIGLPVLIAEILIGRTAQRNPVGAFRKLSKTKFWTFVGGMGIVTGFIIISFYNVVAGWSFGYIIEAVKGSFNDFSVPKEAGEHFESLTTNVPWIISFLGIFVIASMSIVYSGIQKGIERGSKIMMPVLFILLIVLMIRGLTLDGASKGLDFLFTPDWSKITGTSVLEALGQAFFTMSVGMGVMITYGSYMSKRDNIPSSALKIVILDTLISLVAGIAIFTSVFAYNLEPDSGPGLIFHIIPVVFTKMPGGQIFAVLFFILLTIAALTSTISLFEVVVSYFVDEKGWKRKNTVIICGIIIFLLGIPSALSFNVIKGYTLFDKTFFDIMEYISSNILLPLGGFLIAVFVAWFWGFDAVIPKLKQGAGRLFERSGWLIDLWKPFLRYLAPVSILLVLLHSIGVLDWIIDTLKNVLPEL